MILKVAKVKKFYQQGQQIIEVFSNLNLEVAKPTSIAILGRSGSGKSTFLSLLAGLVAVDAGEIWINDELITKMGERQLALFRARHLGIVFQQSHLISNLTTLENVLLPLEILKVRGAREQALTTLEKVGLQQRLRHFPYQLSGGEKQRVALARALVVKPNILLADEPSGNLDAETAETVLDLIFNLVQEQNTTLLLVTHDQLFAKKCQQTWPLKNGSFQ